MPFVEVLPHNPEWKRWFEELRRPIWDLLNDLIIDIVHIGSTSIRRMSAKPIIDIDIVIDNWDIFPELVKRLESHGYEHVGDMDITNREVFKHNTPNYPHHLYVCHEDSTAYQNHILLRKHLLENPEDFNRYKELKTRLARTVDKREDYWSSKTELILEFLEKEGCLKKRLKKSEKKTKNNPSFNICVHTVYRFSALLFQVDACTLCFYFYTFIIYLWNKRA
jgi:GrpB-like predicted nucleotidyltransferase (UPF0157 family)